MSIIDLSNNIEKTEQKTKKNLRKVRAQIIGVDVTKAETAGKSQEKEEEKTGFLDERLISPPFDLLTLTLLKENNTELWSCVEAMEVNIDGFGHRFVPVIDKRKFENNKIPDELALEIKKERIKLKNFFKNVTEQSFKKFRRMLRNDLENTGNCYFEVIRDSSGEEILGFVHLRSYKMRLGRKEEEAVLSKKKVHELQLDENIKITEKEEWRRFRTYAEVSNTSRSIRWYKQFGDSRIYDYETGELADDNLPPEKRANEVVHISIYSGRSPYGLPRYVGNLLSIFGDRASEEINFTTFKNNLIPSMIISVSNGQLTEETITRLKEFSESNIQSDDNYSKFVLVEAEPIDEDGEDGGQIKLDIKPLVSEQHTDALFQKYSKNNKDNVRRAFRLPPIFIGNSVDYNRGTAETSRRLADEQVFAPERDEFDSLMNDRLFPEMGFKYHVYKTNSPATTDNTELVKILSTAEKTGGMTPRIARNLLEDILGVELPEFPEDFDPDVPFSLTMAEAVKNKADASEPGQQVTALKNDKEIEKILLGYANQAYINPLLDHIMDVQKEIEEKWTEGMDEDNHSHEHENF